MKMRIRSAMMKWLVMPVAALMVVASLPKAAFADNYQYTVTVTDGGYGTITSGETEVKLAKGGTWNPGAYEVTPDDAKYEFAGFHVSGREELYTGDFNYQVNQDTIFVAAYRVPGTKVAYTVDYLVYGTGAAVPGSATQTFYGTAGDKIIVPALYFEGYEPRILSEGKTLSDNEADNKFTFTYDVAQGTTTTVTDITNATEYIDQGVTGTTGGAGGAGGAAAGGGAAGGGAAGGGAAAGGEAAGGEAAGGTTIDEGAVPQAESPEEYVDLDETDVPLSDGDVIEGEGEEGGKDGKDGKDGKGDGGETTIDGNQTPLAGLSVPAKVGLGIGAVGVVGVIAWLAASALRKKREE